MAREILFRGKRTDNGVWAYGFLVDKIYGSKPVIVQAAYMEDDCSIEWEYEHVDPATVGQYTGLKDENGKRIFEGDIVRFYERQLGGEDAPIIQQVGYEEGGFCVHRYFLNNWLRNAVNGNIQLEGIEVIGNIHDNPELMKEDHHD